jgi:hypothetical protein
MSATLLALFPTLLRGSAIGSTPAFGAGYLGSSPSPGAKLPQLFSWNAEIRSCRTPRSEATPHMMNFRVLTFEFSRHESNNHILCKGSKQHRARDLECELLGSWGVLGCGSAVIFRGIGYRAGKGKRADCGRNRARVVSGAGPRWRKWRDHENGSFVSIRNCVSYWKD